MRKPDWFVSLNRVIREYQGAPFTWGESDCLHFVADCIAAMTGEDIAAPIRRAYASRLGASRVLARLGHASVNDLLAALLEGVAVPCAIREASLGDIGVSADGVCCINTIAGFIARDEAGTYRQVQPVSTWRLA